MKLLWSISAHWCFQKIIGSRLALWWSDSPRTIWELLKKNSLSCISNSGARSKTKVSVCSNTLVPQKCWEPGWQVMFARLTTDKAVKHRGSPLPTMYGLHTLAITGKGVDENPILNTLSKTPSDIFLAYKKPAGVFLLRWLNMILIKQWQ